MSARQTGKTTIALEGVKEANALFVVHNEAYAIQIRKEFGVEAITPEQLKRLRGTKRPVVYDHVVVENAIRDKDFYERKSNNALADLEKIKEELFIKGEKIADLDRRVTEFLQQVDYHLDVISMAKSIIDSLPKFIDEGYLDDDAGLLQSDIVEFRELLSRSQVFHVVVPTEDEGVPIEAQTIPVDEVLEPAPGGDADER